MLDNKGFNLWANQYDVSVNLSQEANEYPFAGYKDVLNTIYNVVKTKATARILDIGFGTGVLTQKLYNDGYDIYGIDFSEEMIKIAQSKMPNATLVQHDFNQGLPKEIEPLKFDFILCTYAIHHLSDEQKVAFLSQLLECLNQDGKILIGDVAFSTKLELEQCRDSCGDGWDNDEIYPVLEVLSPFFPKVQFEKISFCSGVLSFTK